jgi:hypothetical protein
LIFDLATRTGVLESVEKEKTFFTPPGLIDFPKGAAIKVGQMKSHYQSPTQYSLIKHTTT